jgi:hypothetical protein
MRLLTENTLLKLRCEGLKRPYINSRTHVVFHYSVSTRLQPKQYVQYEVEYWNALTETLLPITYSTPARHTPYKVGYTD